MNYQLHPAFQDWDSKEAAERTSRYEKPEGLTLTYKTIPGIEPGTELELKIFSPASDTKLPNDYGYSWWRFCRRDL